MSYILDALKKADRDRHQTAVPTPATVHRTPTPPLRRRRLWPWIAGAVIVVNAGVWLWLLRPSPSVQNGVLVSVAQEPAISPAPAAREQVTPPTTRRVPSVPRLRLEHNSDVPPLSATKPAQVTSAGAAAPRSASPPKPEIAPEKVPALAVDSAPVKSPQRDPVTPMASQESPVPQDVFANLRLQVHVYSEIPAERRVFINNQKYVEGQRIDANLVVESITSDGVFVSYQGKRVLLRTD